MSEPTNPNRDVDESIRQLRIAEQRRTLRAIREAPGGGSGRPSIRGSRKSHSGSLGAPHTTIDGSTVQIASSRVDGQAIILIAVNGTEYVAVRDHLLALRSASPPKILP